MSEIKLYPVGSTVEYHGSITDKHGLYIVETHHRTYTPNWYLEQNPDAYPNKKAYCLWPVDVEQRFGNRNHGISNVRHASLTLVSLPGEEAEESA